MSRETHLLIHFVQYFHIVQESHHISLFKKSKEKKYKKNNPDQVVEVDIVRV